MLPFASQGLLTVSGILNPLVHRIRVPASIAFWSTGNENVNPSSLFLPAGGWKSGPSVATNDASLDAMKSNRACEMPR